MTDTTNAAPTSTGSGSVEEAAEKMARFLSGEPEKRKSQRQRTEETEPEPVQAQAEDDEGDEYSGDDAEETSDEGEEPEDGSEEAPADATEDEAEEGSAEDDKLYTVKVDGKEVQVPLDELLKGYSRTADYHRKTEALAQERRSFHAEVEQVQQERSQYAQLLPALAQQLQSSLPPPPDPALRETDPLAYVLAKDRHEEAVGKLTAAFSEMQRVQQVQIAEQTRLLAASVEQAREKLPELVPAWKDPKAYERDKPKLREYLKKSGYSDEELDQAYDPRAVATAWKAMRYDELVSKRPRPNVPLEKALQPAPPSVSRQTRSTRESVDARKRLAHSGRIEDAAAAIRSLL